MKTHTTNYYNTFITVADDCPATLAEVPVSKGNEPTLATMQFNLMYDNPYRYSSDDILFTCFALKNRILANDLTRNREEFYAKGQPCLRSSPLTKRYGWGIHFNNEGKVALYAIDSDEYKRLVNDKNLKVIKAMRNKRG